MEKLPLTSGVKEHETKVHLTTWITLSLTESPVDKLRICRVRLGRETDVSESETNQIMQSVEYTNYITVNSRHA